jgi:hypothetical protein
VSVCEYIFKDISLHCDSGMYVLFPLWFYFFVIFSFFIFPEHARQNESYKQQRIAADIDILAQKSKKKSIKKKKRIIKLNVN